MNEPFFPRKLKIKVTMDMTPLVDIVFLLIAFFMLTSSLGKDHILKVQLPKSETSSQATDQNMVIAISKEGKISVNSQILAQNDFESKLKEILQEKKKQQKNLKVIIRGDKESHYEKIVTIMDLLSEQGIQNFSLAVDKN